MPEQLTTYLDFARQIAYDAGQLTLKYFLTGLQPDTKLDGSPVTIADRQSEESIRGAIEKKYPQHAILGEEFGSKSGDRTATGGESSTGSNLAGSETASFRWIVDPIDGTQSFIHGVPLYSVLIGLEIEGRVEAGVAYFPALNEMISAASGLGAWWNDRSCRVSSVRDLGKSAVCYTDIANFRRYGGAEAFDRLAQRAWFRAGWGDAYGYMLAATGRVEVMLDPIMAIWDCGPFPPIFREAGGFFGDWQGHETIYAGRAVATSLDLLPEVLALLNGSPDEK